jgi:hypothetical protein
MFFKAHTNADSLLFLGYFLQISFGDSGMTGEEEEKCCIPSGDGMNNDLISRSN